MSSFEWPASGSAPAGITQLTGDVLATGPGVTPAIIAGQGGNSGKFLTTDGTSVSWATVSGASIAIGSSITSSTAGSVLYVNSSNQLAQDNAHFFFDDASVHKRLSINAGTAPKYHLQIGGDATVPSAGLYSALATANGTADGILLNSSATQSVGMLWSGTSSGSSPNNFYGASTKGTPSSPTAVATGETPLRIGAYGYDGTNMVPGSKILWTVNGSVSSNVVPIDMIFYADDSLDTETLRISRTGASTAGTITAVGLSAGGAGVVHNNVSGVLSSSLIVNADINASAAISYSKLNLSTSILNSDINATANIAYSKLNLGNSILNADISTSAGIAYSKLNLSASILNADVSASAAIAYSKLNLSTSIVNADINASAAIAYSKLNLGTSIVNADINASAAITYSKLASMSTGQVLLGNAGTPTATTLSGDVTVGATGVTAIGATKVTNAMLAGSIDISTKMTGTLAAGQFPALTGDVTTSAGSLATTLAATSNGTLATLSKSTGVAIHGTNTNDSASAGNIGEYIESVVSAVSFPSTGTYGDLTSISLTAGDWEVTGIMSASRNGGTCTRLNSGISTTTGNSQTGLVSGSNFIETLGPTASADEFTSIPGYRVSLASTTTIYLKFSAIFSVATPVAAGRLSARRMR